MAIPPYNNNTTNPIVNPNNNVINNSTAAPLNNNTNTHNSVNLDNEKHNDAHHIDEKHEINNRSNLLKIRANQLSKAMERFPDDAYSTYFILSWQYNEKFACRVMQELRLVTGDLNIDKNIKSDNYKVKNYRKNINITDKLIISALCNDLDVLLKEKNLESEMQRLLLICEAALISPYSVSHNGSVPSESEQHFNNKYFSVNYPTTPDAIMEREKFFRRMGKWKEIHNEYKTKYLTDLSHNSINNHVTFHNYIINNSIQFRNKIKNCAEEFIGEINKYGIHNYISKKYDYIYNNASKKSNQAVLNFANEFFPDNIHLFVYYQVEIKFGEKFQILTDSAVGSIGNKLADEDKVKLLLLCKEFNRYIKINHENIKIDSLMHAWNIIYKCPYLTNTKVGSIPIKQLEKIDMIKSAYDDLQQIKNKKNIWINAMYISVTEFNLNLKYFGYINNNPINCHNKIMKSVTKIRESLSEPAQKFYDMINNQGGVDAYLKKKYPKIL
jgi:hypothetical protein